MYRSVGLALLVLAGIINSASACSCVPRPEKYLFCKNDFAVAFQVKDSGTVEGEFNVYQVDLLHMYRTVPFENLDTDRIMTAGDNLPCGVAFIPNAFYVISGNYNVTSGQPTRMQAHFCELLLIFPNDPRLTYTPPECDTPGSQNGYSGG
ncbi:uncharacterized protein LOC123539161 [Mercenaria mercenaria]|uniref:uncharacterized protein LOC123539161 n=1 Tax=Mercenaria mercenaria TaxID=6596 RepID=UPI001E1D9BF4|nr:uncharacterized protein LOC123539161 [Mercenaria mercenaria]